MSSKDPEAKILAALAKLSEADRNLAAQQRFCVVLPKSRLGSMGTPVKLDVNGKTVFLSGTRQPGARCVRCTRLPICQSMHRTWKRTPRTKVC